MGVVMSGSVTDSVVVGFSSVVGWSGVVVMASAVVVGISAVVVGGSVGGGAVVGCGVLVDVLVGLGQSDVAEIKAKQIRIIYLHVHDCTNFSESSD